ncbi:MAG: pyridoxamine 5'-phosphate oxidase [Sphingobacteriales bacterium]|nr:MAG: pyridoxamine 5'-phosphate oxidase [Sphingobacteriales bacterium]
MKTVSLKSLAAKMKNLDFCMMTTTDGRGTQHTRPMSNNGQVEYDGTSWFFTYLDSNKVRQIQNHPHATLTYQTPDMLFVECYGDASVITQKSMMADHWVEELNRWFPQGLETPDICMVKVTANRVRFWDQEGDGEYRPA